MEVEMQQMEEQMGTPNRDRQRPASSRIASTLPRKPPSVLDSGLGEEVLDIVYPCTICMFFVIFLVQLLRLGEQGSDSTPSLGQAYYQEQVDDTAAAKLTGSLINALIFVATVTVATFCIFLLFKYNCTKAIWGFMAFSGLSVFFVFGDVIILAVLQEVNLAVDTVSFYLMMWNFSVVGIVSVFFWEMPLTLKQGNLICIAATTAYIFCRLPEWTTLVLLIFMAVYDLGAVLLPMGPLRVLVELAVEREEAIPALVYEARSVRRAVTVRTLVDHEGRSQTVGPQPHPSEECSAIMPAEDSAAEASEQPAEAPPLPTPQGTAHDEEAAVVEAAAEEDADAPLLSGGDARSEAVQQGQVREHVEVEEQPGIKLGLGDFIFYSVLVGRAAMYDMVVAFAAYMAIVAGLAMTLLLLALYQKALPALPISIFLGVALYLLGRLLLDPFIAGMYSNLVYF